VKSVSREPKSGNIDSRFAVSGFAAIPASPPTSGSDCACHHDEKEEEVRPDDAAYSAEERIDDRGDDRDKEYRIRINAEEDDADLDCGEYDIAEDEHVEYDAEVDRAHGAEERRRLPGIPELVELYVGRHPGTHPQLRIHENGEKPRQNERPHYPVAAHAVATDHLGEEIRGVCRRRRGHHREADQPPRHGVPGVEEVPRRPAAFERSEGRNERKHDEEHYYDSPVESVQKHFTPPPL